MSDFLLGFVTGKAIALLTVLVVWWLGRLGL
jgi:hypothetical protein